MLSEEEKEAIEILENEKFNLYVLQQTKFITCTVEQAKAKRKAINTVLKLITKLQKENEDLKKENKELNEELNKENNRCMILANNDKFKEQVIDLMAEKIELLNNDFDDFCIYEICDEDCKNCIKKYFEKLVKEKQE